MPRIAGTPRRIARRVPTSIARGLSTQTVSNAQTQQQALLSSLRGTSLGDDTLGANTQLLQKLVDSQQRIEAQQKTWFEGDLFWKRLGVIATVMIPVSAAIWRKFGIGRRKPKP